MEKKEEKQAVAKVEAAKTPAEVVVEKPNMKEEKKLEEVVVKSQPSNAPVKKSGMSFKTILWVIFFILFACAFTMFGVLIGTKVIPAIDQWLIEHNFKEASTTINRESASPFLPQPTNQVDNGAKGSSGLTIPQVVNKVSAGVVSIAISSNSSTSDASVDAIGTGFVVDAAGLVITNQHVVNDADATYKVVTQDNKSYEVTLIVRDDVNDVALLVVEATDLSAISMGDSEAIQVGETVIAIGNPLGEFPGSVTVGVISGVKRSVSAGSGFWQNKKTYENVVQTDAAVNPGNSGGPLLNLSGEVIGVNFATTGSADNISFALPINIVKQRVSEFKQTGKFITPFLGVSYRMITKQEASYFGAVAGASIKSVAKDSPAERAGLLVGDIITKINGNDMSSSLADALAKYKIGEEISVTVFRSDKSGTSQTLTVKVVLAEKP